MQRTADFMRVSRRVRMTGTLLFLSAFFVPVVSRAFPYGAPTNLATGLDQGAGAAFGYLNNDTNLDLVVCGRNGAGTNRQLQFYLGNGAGFGGVNNVNGNNGGEDFCSVALGDYDNDGDMDILVMGRLTGAAGSPQMRVYRNNGGAAPTFTLVEVNGVANAGLSTGAVAWGDVDNDGDLDIAAEGTDGTNRQLLVYKNNGNGTFAKTFVVASNQGFSNGGVAWGDFDKDGDMDLLVSGLDWTGARQVRVYRNDGNGVWTAVNVAAAGGGLSDGDCAFGDFNGDGNLDVVAMGTDGTNRQLRVYLNNGNGTFNPTPVEVPANTANQGLTFGRVAVGDSNNDGFLDIAAMGTDGTNRQLRVYLGNGAATPTFTVNNVPGAANQGLQDGGLAFGDFNNDGKVDLGVAGLDSTATQRVRTYANTVATANTAPGVPAGLTPSFTFAESPALSAATFKWNPATDSGAGTTLQNVLAYDVQISTTAAFTGTSTFPSMLDATPQRGAYQRPPLSGGQHYVVLSSTYPQSAQAAPEGLRLYTTYYFRVRTVDAGLMQSAWSAASTGLYTGAPPRPVADLATAAATTDGQIVLNWTSPTGAATAYDIRWSLAPITNDAQFAAATAVTLTSPVPSPQAPGAAESWDVRGVPPERTVYFALKSSNAYGTSVLSNSPNGVPLAFDRTPIEVDPAPPTGNGGLDQGDVTWGDIDGDGLWDIVAVGFDTAGARRLRIYRNLNGTFAAPVELVGKGLSWGNVALGDFNGDGKPDILVSGNDGTNRQLYVYKNTSVSGAVSFNLTPVTVDPGNGWDSQEALAGSGCGAKWADMDNDGDLDVVVCGNETRSGLPKLAVYFNNGNGTFTAPTYVATPALNLYHWGDLAVADFDGDGRMDIAVTGFDSTGNTTPADARIGVYRNNGAGGFTETLLAGALGSGGLDAGDYNNDGKPDILVSGFDGAGTTGRQIRAYPNTSTIGAVSFGAAILLANGTGINRGEVAWGDYNNDGKMDGFIAGAANGAAGIPGELQLFPSNGAGFNAMVNVAEAGGGMVNRGSIAVGDFDGDGDVDVVAIGRTQVGGAGNGIPDLRVYVNYWDTTGVVNNAPAATTLLETAFAFSANGISTATFKWKPATDDITPQLSLRYQVQAATTTPLYSIPLAINTPAPQLFPKTFDCSLGLQACYGTVLTSTNPWNPQSGTLTGLITDSTYTFHAKTIDGGSLDSGWSADATLWTGVAPSSSVITASATLSDQGLITWASAGDDDIRGTLTTGSYRIQYSTNPSAAWSTSSTPAGATTITISTANQAPGTAESTTTAAALLEATSYYYRLWTQDHVGQWSAISNQATYYIPVPVRDLTLSATQYIFGTAPLGLSTGTTVAVTVTFTGNRNSTFQLSASTVTPGGSPWSLFTSTGPDRAVVYAGFNAGQPLLTAFGSEDVVLTAPQSCTSGVPAAYGIGQGCMNLTPGTAQSIWFRVDMPSTSSSQAEQYIQVTITAGPP